LRINFCGVRGSTPAPGIDFIRYGGHTSCLALTHSGGSGAGGQPGAEEQSNAEVQSGAEEQRPTLILDAGAGLQTVSAGLLDGAPFDGTILLSHLHWDHVLGLPFFASGDNLRSRVSVILPDQENGESADVVLGRMMAPPYFPVKPTQLRGDWSFATIAPGEQQIEGFSVLAREIPHKGGRTFGYRISDGHSTLAYIPDHCPTTLGPGEDGFGEYHSAAIELAKDADVLVHDAQLLPEELPAEADFGHAAADYAVALARRAGTRSVVLFHHRHDRTDDALDKLAGRLGGGSAPEVSVAREGLVLNL
jgi:ribonuclease BN (tRNA processing enzyme)